MFSPFFVAEVEHLTPQGSTHVHAIRVGRLGNLHWGLCVRNLVRWRHLLALSGASAGLWHLDDDDGASMVMSYSDVVGWWTTYLRCHQTWKINENQPLESLGPQVIFQPHLMTGGYVDCLPGRGKAQVFGYLYPLVNRIIFTMIFTSKIGPIWGGLVFLIPWIPWRIGTYQTYLAKTLAIEHHGCHAGFKHPKNGMSISNRLSMTMWYRMSN